MAERPDENTASASTTGSDDHQATDQPGPFDVLLGRGKSNRNHPGNIHFQGKLLDSTDQFVPTKETVQLR
jgi:hypothetical protein